MKKKLSGSYTIEAVFVMAVVLWTMAAVIQYGYEMGSRTKGAMNLHQGLEKERQESTERTVKGEYQVGKWKLEILMSAFHPEEFMRMYTLFEAVSEE